MFNIIGEKPLIYNDEELYKRKQKKEPPNCDSEKFRKANSEIKKDNKKTKDKSL